MKETIEIRNLKHKFLDFYYEAKERNADVDEAYAIWKAKYGFAAIPPTEEGEKEGRRLFELAYPQYEAYIPKIEAFSPSEDHLLKILNQVRQLLDYQGHIQLMVIFFVGFFEKNAFVAPYGEKGLALCLPIEYDEGIKLDILVAHELTHVVHASKINGLGKWERSLANLILQEGLAMKSSQLLVPGLKECEYLSNDSEWFTRCESKKEEILKNVSVDLMSQDSDILFKYSMGQGSTGEEREAYYVAWLVINHFLDNGYTLSELASWSEVETDSKVAEVISILTQKPIL